MFISYQLTTNCEQPIGEKTINVSFWLEFPSGRCGELNHKTIIQLDSHCNLSESGSELCYLGSSDVFADVPEAGSFSSNGCKTRELEEPAEIRPGLRRKMTNSLSPRKGKNDNL